MMWCFITRVKVLFNAPRRAKQTPGTLIHA
jgi:hypothetical protein